jgi:hypothetical protein
MVELKPLRSIMRSYYPDLTVCIADYLDEGDVIRECRITVGQQSVVISSRYLFPDKGDEGLLEELEVICRAIETLQRKGLPTVPTMTQ